MSKRIKKGKIIVIEGIDASGKNTQAELLVETLQDLGVKIATMSFPCYGTPTGKIVGGAYLGKKELGKCVFPEGAGAVDWRIASMYYAADRLYNVGEITALVDSGVNVVLDRYSLSNMAFQASKCDTSGERERRYEWLDGFEYGMLGLPRPDVAILLDMPVEWSLKLMKKAKRVLDGHEKDTRILRAASVAYKEIAMKYKMRVINPIEARGELRSREDIAAEILAFVAEKLDVRLPSQEAKFFWT